MAIGVNQYQVLSPEQANPFGYGLTQGIAARLNQAKAAEQEAKNPYVGPQAEADVNSTLLKNIYQNLVNKYTPQDYESQFALRGANTRNLDVTTDLSRLKLKYPGLGEGGIVGQLAYANLLSDHPEYGQRINAAMGINQQQGDMAQGPAPSTPALGQAIVNSLPSQNQVYNPLQILMKDINADIGGKQALADYRSMGGGRGGVTQQQQMVLQHQIMKDNPGMSQEQAFDAAGNLVNGKTTLSDGTPFNVSGLTQLSADKAVMQGTTAALVTQSVKANQADKELKVLNDYAQKGIEPYGDTFLGMNGQQIADTFKSDDESQKRLGRFAAAQALQYEAAQNRIRLANGQPGVTTSEELMKLSQQMINAKYPAMSYKARKESARYLDEALEKGLQARNEFGMHPSRVNANVPTPNLPVQPKPQTSSSAQIKGTSSRNAPISDADIRHTAKVRGMTEEEVRARLKQEGRL